MIVLHAYSMQPEEGTITAYLEARDRNDVENIFKESKHLEEFSYYEKDFNISIMEIYRLHKRAIGFISYNTDKRCYGPGVGDNGYIHVLAIAQAYRQKGYGTALLLHALHHLKEQQIKTVYLRVARDNYAAKHLYANVGFHFNAKDIENHNQYILDDLQEWTTSDAKAQKEECLLQ